MPPGHTKYDVDTRGSTAAKALETAWAKLREVEPAIPPAVLTLVDVRSRRRTNGYFSWSVWRKRRGAAHEIGVSPRLIGHPSDLLATLVHEAAHAVLYEAGLHGGVSEGGYYHNKKFRDQCLAFGLTCQFRDTRHGFSITAWPKGQVPSRYRSVLYALRTELPAGTGDAKPPPNAWKVLPSSGLTPLRCGCPEEFKRVVRVKKSVLQAGGLRCDLCGKTFEIWG